MRVSICLAGTMLIVAALGQVAAAAEPKTPEMVLRISSAVLADVHKSTFSHEQAIEDTVLGTSIKGKAKSSGKFNVKPCAKTDGLTLTIAGQSISKTEGRNSGAIIHSTTTTDFVATAPLSFDAKHGFVAGDIEVEATSKMTTDRIDSTQTGIAGTVIKRVAANKVAASKAEAEAHAQELAKVRIEKEVSSELQMRVDKLNAACAKLRPVMDAVRRDNAEYTLHTCEGQLIVCAKHADSARFVAGLPDTDCRAEIRIATGVIDTTAAGKLVAATQPAAGIPAATDLRPIDRQAEWWVVQLD